MALRDRLKSTLDELERNAILATVTEPTPWVSSLVVVSKKDGRLRLCLDPKDLNRAILREHYPLPTIEEVATRLNGAKCFSILDAQHGFWHIPLDEESSLLPHSFLHLGATDGNAYHLESHQLPRCFNGECMKSLKDSGELR